MSAHVPLTERELDVLRALVFDGADNVTIGRRVGIAEDTVKCHIRSLLRKTGFPSRTAVAVAAHRRDFVPVRVIQNEAGEHYIAPADIGLPVPA